MDWAHLEATSYPDRYWDTRMAKPDHPLAQSSRLSSYDPNNRVHCQSLTQWMDQRRSQHQPFTGRVTVVSGSIGSRPFAQVTRRRLEEYAKQHDYRFQYFDDWLDPNYGPHWQRILALQQALKGLEPGDVAVWFDDDIYITNRALKLELWLSFTTKDLIFSRDPSMLPVHRINSGLFLVRKSGLTETFLADWLAGYDLFGGYYRSNQEYDQGIVNHLFYRSYHPKIELLPCRVIQSFVVPSSWPSSYRPGDFCLHYAGIPLDQRNRLIPELDRIMNR